VTLSRIERRIRLAGALVLMALVLAIVSILWKHPLSFASLHVLALFLFVAGCAVYLLALLPGDEAHRSDREHPLP
jgi:heme A synthase